MNQLDASSELDFIKKIMEDSRKIVILDAKPFIFWGLIIALGQIANYLFIKMQFDINPYIFWAVLIVLGWAYSMFFFFRASKIKQPFTFASKILLAVWTSCGISMTLIGFISSLTWNINPTPFITVIMGIGYYITGYLSEFKWIKYISLGWWLSTIILFLWPGFQSAIIMALSMIFFQVIPGIVINRTKTDDILKAV